jgi:DNA polymerase-3 subunit alpha/error-prone DNA polymerase
MGRSNFSFLQGASHPEEMVQEAMRLGYQGLALCDLNGLYGVARGHRAAHNPSFFEAQVQGVKSFKYFVGSEIHLTNQLQLCLLPMNKSGYTQLCKLLTFGKSKAAKGFSQIHEEDFFHHKTDDLLVFLIPPFSDEQFQKYQSHFQNRIYIPVWKDLTWESLKLYQNSLRLEETYEAQLFVTNRPYMHHHSRKALFDVLTCAHHQTQLYKANHILVQNAEHYLHDLQHIQFLWKERMDLVDKTVEIGDRIQFSLDEIRYRYPKSKIPDDMSVAEYLDLRVRIGLKWRYGENVPQFVQDLARHELALIKDLEYEDYFLTLDEICEFARQKQILYQGRGSAANSVVCFALGLTSVDPTKIDLLFERFLSKERNEPPDIDIDFEHERREEVIQHIYEKYSKSHAAMVCTVIRYRSRMALREVGKAFGFTAQTMSRIVQFMGRDGVRRLKEAEKIWERFDIKEGEWNLLLALTQELHGFPRHLGIHTGGFLISQEPIADLVPVEKATMDGRHVVQWNKDDINALKLMKIDVLSLGMLTALRKALQLLENHKGLNYNLATLPQEDTKTYDMICKADTVGVFQIESRAQMNTLPRLKPRCFYDLVVEVALVRPGPLQGGMVHPYLRRRQGLEKIIYPHPDLELVLRKTLGVPIFQEQVMKIAVVAAGFTPGEADELRRLMSDAWRKKTTMDGVRNRILSGLAQNGVKEEYALQIYKTIEGFANYGFPESHAASFALLTYASCYIKCHHPDVFVCSLLNSQPMGFYSPRTLVAEAQRHGVEFLPLSVNASDYDYTLEKSQTEYQLASQSSFHLVRMGLRSIQRIPKKLIQQMLTERKANGLFKDFTDFIKRTKLPKSAVSYLIAAGAFSEFAEQPRELLWKLESTSLDENSFLWGHDREPTEENSDEEIPEESPWEEMHREYDHKGFSLHLHPLSVMRPYLEQKNEQLRTKRYVPYATSKDISEYKHKQKIRVAGLVSVTQRPPTAKGFCFITLEDEFGFMNIVIHPEVYQRDRLHIYGHSLLEIQGEVEHSGPLTNIRAIQVRPIWF